MELGVILCFVTYSTLRGAQVTPCHREPNAEFKAGFLSAIFFMWFSPIIDVGQTKQLDLDDLPVQVPRVPSGCCSPRGIAARNPAWVNTP